MWGGRFAAGPSAIMREINASIPFDKRLWKQDIAASCAHVAMLAACDIVSDADAQAIIAGLETIADEYARDGVPENWDLEDIHMTTEARLAELIGPAAGRLHTARSRNDQVATDFRLWVRDTMDALLQGLVLREEAPSAPDIVKAAMEQGLLLVPAGPRVVRFVPPLTMRPRELREAVARLERALLSLA